jgi:hypothetical protein
MGAVLAMMGRVLLPLAAVALLSGCGSDAGALAGFGFMRDAATEMTNGRDAPESPRLTREEIRATGLALQQVEVEATGIVAYLGVQGVRGDVVTWATTSRENIALRGGVLIQTRGLGADLMSAAVPDLGQLLTGTTVERRFFHLRGDEATIETAVTCTPRVVGRETVEIVGLAYDTARIDEDCANDTVAFTNSFWIDGAGNLRKSRQWAGEVLGALVISDLRE